MHLLKGHSSVEEHLDALGSLEANRRGAPAVMDARDFFYSRIALSPGAGVLVQVFDTEGAWLYCNEAAAGYLQQAPGWFIGRSLRDMPALLYDWSDIIPTVCRTRETYIDRTRRGLLNRPRSAEEHLTWSVLAFPVTLHDHRNGVVLTARVVEKSRRASDFLPF